MRMTSTRRAVGAFRLATFLLCATGPLAVACSLVFDPELKEFSEYGARCLENDDCASGICKAARCSESCTGSCDGNAECVQGACQFLSPAPLDGPPKIGYLVMESEVTDYGMVKAHDDGRAYVLSHVPESSAIMKMGTGAAGAPSAIDELVDQGCNVIVGTHSDYLNAIQNGAIRYPTVNFLLYSNYAGFEPGPNLGAYMGRMYQVMYLMGNLAARKSTTNRVGIVAPVAEPDTVTNVNAYVQGARAYNTTSPPEVVVRWINYWSSRDLEEQAVEELAAADVDVVLGYTDTTTPIATAPSKTASGETVYVIGYSNKNACDEQPSRCLSSAYWNWGPLLTEIIEDMQAGAWEPAALWENITGNPSTTVVYFADLNALLLSPTHTVAVGGLVTNLASNPRYPFVGPVRDTSGSVRIPSGNTPSDDDLLQMCWHVQGTLQLGEGEPYVLEPAEVPLTCRGIRED